MPENENRGSEGAGPEDPGLGPTQRQGGLDRGETVRPRQALAAPTDNLSQAETIRGRKPGDKVFSGRYELKRILGRGGMGVVWLALDRELEHEVALKFLPEVMAYNEAAIMELKRETKKALLLTHPHIVRIHGWERDAENAAVSMEYVDGRTLATLKAERENGCLEVADIREWVQQLCEALEYAHSKAKVVHRDLKPQNLMVNSKGDLKITDFGISRSLEESVSKTTRGGAGFSGTLSYMSPQQLEGRMSEPSDDLYALGATIYELLTGKPPFHTGDIGKQIAGKVPPSLAERRRELGLDGGEAIPAEWEAVVAACLAKEPGQRPTSAMTVWAGLEENHQGTKSTQEKLPANEDSNHGGTEGEGGDGTRSRSPSGRQASPQEAPGAMRGEEQSLLTSAPTRESCRAGALPKGGKGKWLAAAVVVVLAASGAWWWPGKEGDDAATPSKGASNLVAVPPEQPPRAGEALKNGIGMELVWIVPGEFTMGSSASKARLGDYVGPQTKVTLTKGYWLGRYEVTQGEYEAVMGSNPSHWKGVRLPVETVSWTNIMDFCRKLTDRERSAGRLPTGYEYQLPTEAQWEYACRAGTKTRFSFGDSDGQLGDAGWYIGNSGNETHPVGQKQPNAWGLYDMHGNVYEWCVDWAGNYPGGSVTDPVGPSSGSYRVGRGGGWYRDAGSCRSAYRDGFRPGIRGSDGLGFRAALVSGPTGNQATQAERPAKAEEQKAPRVPQAGQPYENGLGMKFVPVPGTQVLFSIWETRVKDFAAFARDSANNGGWDYRKGTEPYVLKSDGWKQRGWEYGWENPGFAQTPEHPVTYVSWEDAVACCRWLTETERKAGRLGAGQEYRLPTDAEWSCAVGIGDRESGSTPLDKDGKLKDVYPWGNQWPPPSGAGNYAGEEAKDADWPSNFGVINGYRDGYARTSPAGQFDRNRYGLFDMGGNVWEWCQDWYDGDQKYRVLRGASWCSGDADFLLSSTRYNHGSPVIRDVSRGFRLVLVGGSAR